MVVAYELRSILATNPGVQALCGTRIWAGVDTAAGYRPVAEVGNALTGPGLVLSTQDGDPGSTGVVRSVIVQMRCFAADGVAAHQVEAAVFAALEGKQFARIRSIWRVTEPQERLDGRGWTFVFVTYRCITT